MSLVNTQLLDAIVIAKNGKMGKAENRLSNYGVLQAFKDNAPMLLPETSIKAMKKSARHPLKIPLLNKFTGTVLSAPSCNITGVRPTSAYKSLNWAFVGFEMTSIPSVNEDNYFTQADDLANQLQNNLKAVFSQLDTNCFTAIEANKSAVGATVKNATFASSTYNFVKPLDQFFTYAPAIMEANDLNGSYIDIASTESRSTLLNIMQQSAYNQKNVAGSLGALQYAENYKHYRSNRVVSGSNEEVHYLMPEGTIGIYNWVDKDSQVGREAGNKKWYTMQDPVFGFDWGVYEVEDCVDASVELSGNTRAYGQKFQWGAYFAIVTDYSSDTSSPIFKFTLNPA